MGVFLRNSNWYISFTYKGRRIKEKVGPSKTLALKALKKREVEVAEEKFLDVRRLKLVKLSALIEDYVRLHAQQKKSFKTHYQVSIKRIRQFFGDPYLHEITTRRVEDFRAAERKVGLTESSVNRRLACLKNMYNKAID